MWHTGKEGLQVKRSASWPRKGARTREVPPTSRRVVRVSRGRSVWVKGIRQVGRVGGRFVFGRGSPRGRGVPPRRWAFRRRETRGRVDPGGWCPDRERSRGGPGPGVQWDTTGMEPGGSLRTGGRGGTLTGRRTQDLGLGTSLYRRLDPTPVFSKDWGWVSCRGDGPTTARAGVS